MNNSLNNLEKIIEDSIVEGLRLAATHLPTDVSDALKKEYSNESGNVAKVQLEAIIKNFELADELKLPICQDTGVVAFFVKLGENFPVKAKLKDILIKATERATKEVPLRPNAVDLFKGNTKTNVGLRGHIPWIYWEVVPGDDLEVIVMPKGGGSSNVSKLGMLTPGVGIKGIKKFVIDTVAKAGAKGCPPYIVGVGIGGGEDMCMTLAKKALLRKIGERHPDPKIAEMEEELLNALNKLGIGVMGLGDGNAVLDVHIEIMARHPASLPVGVVLSCWALRHSYVKVTKDGKVTLSDHIP
ncbi:MAG: fumarate hydratase [Candidatus Asgardarchaeia archaeon]